jgi:TolB-like protein
VDFRAGELRKHGIRIALQEKPLRILEALLGNAGGVVTREELRGRLWPDATFVEFDHSINIAVSKLRRALNDAGVNPRFVETLSRKGYRFIAPVERPAAARAPRKIMLAVLPFLNLSGDPEQSYFSDGLTEETINQLGRLNPRELGVIARMTAMHYRAAPLSAAEIGRELGVDYIVEGSVRQWTGRVRITARLIQVSDQTHLWADTYDRTLSDILDIQGDVTRRIACALAMELLPAAQASQPSSRITSAYEAYLKGRYFWSRRTEDGHTRALECFEQAIRADPDFALAYAGIADVHNTLGLFSAVSPGLARCKSIEAAVRALELDRYLAEAHTALAYAKSLYEWDWAQAERGFQTALELNANYVTAHQWYGHLLAMTGRFHEALEELDRALQLDPLSLVAGSHKGWILHLARRFDEAAATLRGTLEIDPGFALGHYFLGLARLAGGRAKEAIAALKSANRISPDHPGVLSAMVQGYVESDLRSEAMGVMEALERLAEARYVSPYFLARAQIHLGDRDRGLALLERAIDARCPWMAYLNVDPAMDLLRADPRMHVLLRRIGFRSADPKP